MAGLPMNASKLSCGLLLAGVGAGVLFLMRRKREQNQAAPEATATAHRVVPAVTDSAQAAPIVRSVGVCIVEHVLSTDELQQLQISIQQTEPQKLQNRRAHRWEHVHSPQTEAFAKLAAHPAVATAAQALLGPKHYLEKCGLIVSHPGSEAQRWHMDTPHLFACREHLPVHSLTVFVPLCDLVTSNGPTEFQLHTHIKANLPKQKVHATACCGAGSVVLYDTRIMHRGGPNASDTDRTLVYLTLSRIWYRDTLNP